jgi:hypothetical protein
LRHLSKQKHDGGCCQHERSPTLATIAKLGRGIHQVDHVEETHATSADQYFLMSGAGRLPPGSFPSQILPVAFQAARVNRWRQNGEKWWLCDGQLMKGQGNRPTFTASTKRRAI